VRARFSIRWLATLAAALCALGLGACGNTLQRRPIPHNTLESLILAPYPVYWAGYGFHGLSATEVRRDPGGAFAVQYGNCIRGGQATCVPPLTVITSPDNSFVPGEKSTNAHRTRPLRGVESIFAEHGRAISVPTGEVVVNIYAHKRALALAAAQTAVPIDRPAVPGSLLPARQPDSGFDGRPLPSQLPPPLQPLG
jgi:hypothetical protein